MDYLKLLDEIIDIFKNSEPKQRAYTTRQIINQLSSRQIIVSYEITKEAIVKLIKDEILRIDIPQEGSLRQFSTSNYYILTLEGYMFNGYQKQKITDDRTEKQKVRNERLLIAGTLLAGIAGLAVVGWELYKHYYLHID